MGNRIATVLFYVSLDGILARWNFLTYFLFKAFGCGSGRWHCFSSSTGAIETSKICRYVPKIFEYNSFVNELSLKIKAAFWYNLHASGVGDPRTQHGACPIISGSKWGRFLG